MKMSRFDWAHILKQILVPLLILILVLIQASIYGMIYPPRIDYTDYDDAFLFLILAAFVYLLILIFQRSIQKSIARIFLQVGWAIVLVIAIHTVLIQFFDRSYPYNRDTLTALFTMLHENTNLLIVISVIFSSIGVYYWVVDIGVRERRFHSVVSAMPVGVAVLDKKGRVILHNDGLSKLLGIKNDEIQNALLSDLFKLEYQVLASEMGESSGPIQLDVLLESEYGQKKYLSVDIVTNKDRIGRTIGQIVVVSDVTIRRRAEEEREQQRRVIELYASLLSHDIGNDLQAILGYIESVSMLLREDPDRAEKMLNSAEAASLRMANLVRTFQNDTTPSHIYIDEMLKEVAERAEAVSMNLTVDLDISSEISTYRSPGGSLLPIAFENLLRNSAQHAGPRPRVVIRAGKENDDLVIRLTDNGPGIPQELHKNIFNRSNPRREGGMGLYLAKQIIIACDGHIEMEPNGPGATFKITLPLIE